MRRLLALAALLPGLGLASPVAMPPAALKIPLGEMTLVALRDAGNVVPNDNRIFGSGQTRAAVAATLAAAHRPTDRVGLAVDALLVRLPGGRLVLIDSGLGPTADGRLLASLRLAEIEPGAITDVLLTHAHPDHAGGLLDAQGRPRFPRALIHLAAPEWAAWRADPTRAAQAATLAPRVRPFAPGATVLPGITALPLPGHTPGHTGYRLLSAGRELLDIGDLAHSSVVSLAHPEWLNGYDGDPALARQTRLTLLPELARRGTLLFAPHFPFPGFGRIAAAPGGGFRWIPLR